MAKVIKLPIPGTTEVRPPRELTQRIARIAVAKKMDPTAALWAVLEAGCQFIECEQALGHLGAPQGTHQGTPQGAHQGAHQGAPSRGPDVIRGPSRIEFVPPPGAPG